MPPESKMNNFRGAYHYLRGIFEKCLAEFQEVVGDELFQEGQLWVL